VTKSEIIDNDNSNKAATVVDDLKKLKKIKNNTYDCLIITQTLGMIDDYQAAIREMHRILMPGGVLLLTVSAMSPDWQLEKNYWRFTVDGAKYAFKTNFKSSTLDVESYGNVLTVYSFLVGLAQEEIPAEKLQFNDPHFPLIITVKATKL
jgi:ubiquinone/menaquinone biosynthesis C-methylase UbiE